MEERVVESKERENEKKELWERGTGTRIGGGRGREATSSSSSQTLSLPILSSLRPSFSFSLVSHGSEGEYIVSSVGIRKILNP